MAHDQDPAEWVPLSRPDADTDQLQRSLEHVEKLLERLEYLPSAYPAEGWALPADGGRPHDVDGREGSEPDLVPSGAPTRAHPAGSEVRDAVGRAHNVADEIRMAAKRDAQEIVNTTCARIRRQLGDAEAMAVEILGTAEFKALEIERDGVSTEATESAAVMARAPGEPAAATTAEDAQQLVLLAVARMQRTLQALDELGEVVSTRAAEMLATAMAVESVLQTEKASPKVWGRSGVDETSSGHRRIDGHTRANGHPVRLESVDLDDRS